jgi:hypothetical protein
VKIVGVVVVVVAVVHPARGTAAATVVQTAVISEDANRNKLQQMVEDEWAIMVIDDDHGMFVLFEFFYFEFVCYIKQCTSAHLTPLLCCLSNFISHIFRFVKKYQPQYMLC